jgi:putative DNA primase/helicase
MKAETIAQDPPLHLVPGVEPRPLTDIGNAERFVAQHGDSIRHVHPWGSWLIFDGKRWAKDETLQIEQLARLTARTIYDEAAAGMSEQDRKALAAHAIKSERKDRLDAMIKLSRSDVPVAPKELDADPWLFSVSNGTLDLRTGELKPHRREDLVTKLAPVAFDEKAKCPKWDEFLKKIFEGNAGLIGFMQRAAGYSLSGLTSEQVLFLLHGLGANGKTTFLETLRRLGGEYARQADFGTFLETDHDGARNDVAALKGARIVMAVEADSRRALSESVVKQITGGDTIAARFLYGEFFEFKPELKLWLAANHRPRIKGTDNAIWRRVRLVPFAVTIPEDERNPHMADELATELSGILAWAVRGCADWQEKGLTAPAEVTGATADYRAEEDQAGRFIEDSCAMNSQATVTAKALFAAYRKWCESVGEKESSQKAFGQRLEEKGFKPERNERARFWKGIHLPGVEADA